VTARNDNVLVISYIPTDVNFHMSFVQPFRFFYQEHSLFLMTESSCFVLKKLLVVMSFSQMFVLIPSTELDFGACIETPVHSFIM